MLTHKGTVTLATERLTLRRFTVNDAEDMFAVWANDERVTRFLTWLPHGTPDVTRAILESWCGEYENDNYYNWAIEFEGKPIGSIGIVRLSERNERVDLGYCIGFDFWGRGIMTEAVCAVIDFLFREVGVNRICISHALKNPGSGKVAIKCGLTYEGTKREYFKASNGEFLDIADYSILRCERENVLYIV